MEQGNILKLSCGYLVGFVLIILSGALYRNFYPLMVLIPALLVPVPPLLCGGGDGNTLSFAFGTFFEMFFWTSTLALAAVMAHTEVIEYAALGFCLAGSVVLFISRVCHEKVVTADDGY